MTVDYGLARRRWAAGKAGPREPDEKPDNEPQESEPAGLLDAKMILVVGKMVARFRKMTERLLCERPEEADLHWSREADQTGWLFNQIKEVQQLLGLPLTESLMLCAEWQKRCVGNMEASRAVGELRERKRREAAMLGRAERLEAVRKIATKHAPQRAERIEDKIVGLVEKAASSITRRKLAELAAA